MKVWSQSKHAYLESAEMHGQHLLNTYRKILRDEYLDAAGEPVSGDARTELLSGIEVELEKRGLDPHYVTGKPPDGLGEGDPFS